jgi:hypothetical protein
MLVCEVLHTLSGPNDAAPAVCARPCRPPHSIRRRATGDAAVAEGRCAAGSRSGYVRSGSNSAVRRSAQCPVCPRTDMAAMRAAKAAGFKKPVIVARHRIVHETSPLSKTPAISRFSRRARSRFTVLRKKTGTCGSFRPDGTMRRWSCLARCWSCAETQGVAARILAPRQGKMGWRICSAITTRS